MIKRLLFPLRAMLKRTKEEEVQHFLSEFRCTRDHDLEEFLKNKAIMYEKKDMARTFILVDNNGDNNKIIGYFTLALTSISVPSDVEISNTMKKHMNLHDGKTTGYLLGQLCKNDDVVEKVGQYLFALALKKFDYGFNTFGGKIVCVDCKPIDSLVRWYESNGFVKVNIIPETNLCRMIWIKRPMKFINQRLPAGNSQA